MSATRCIVCGVELSDAEGTTCAGCHLPPEPTAFVIDTQATPQKRRQNGCGLFAVAYVLILFWLIRAMAAAGYGNWYLAISDGISVVVVFRSLAFLQKQSFHSPERTQRAALYVVLGILLYVGLSYWGFG